MQYISLSHWIYLRITIFALSYNPYSLIYIHVNTITLVLVPYVVPDTDGGYSARYVAGYGTGNIAEKSHRYMRYCLNKTMIKPFESLNHNYSIRNRHDLKAHCTSICDESYLGESSGFWFGVDNDRVTQEMLSTLNI